jgi:cell shape-determining protein MreC
MSHLICDNLVEKIKCFIDDNKKINNEIVKCKNSLSIIKSKESKIYEHMSKNEALRNELMNIFQPVINDKIILIKRLKKFMT